METFARVIYNINTNTVLQVTEHIEESVTSFNILDTEGNTRGMTIGHCSTLYPILVAQGYNVDKLATYMNEKNLEIPVLWHTYNLYLITCYSLTAPIN